MAPAAATTAPAEAPAAAAGAGAAVPLPARRCVLVAKCLTNSDASSGRIILPRVAVETNLPFVLGYRHYALAVRDCRGESGVWAPGSTKGPVEALVQGQRGEWASESGREGPVGWGTAAAGMLAQLVLCKQA